MVYGRPISVSNRQDLFSRDVSVLKAGIISQHVTLIDQVCTLLKTKRSLNIDTWHAKFRFLVARLVIRSSLLGSAGLISLAGAFWSFLSP